MTRSYCVVFQHPHSKQTVMLPAAPASPLSRWDKVRKYLTGVGKIVLQNYFL